MWAADITLTQSSLKLGGSYPASATEITIDGITYVYAALMKSSTNIQARANNGLIYNKTAFPRNIKSVAITHSGTKRSTTILGSTDGKEWTSVKTGSGTITGDFSNKGYKFFKITRGSNAAYWTKIEITFEAVAITSITMDATASVAVGGNVTLTPTVSPANTSETVMWESDNTDIATVSNGAVTGVAVGSTTIRAKSPSNGSIKAECTVTVTAPIAVTDVTLDKTSVTMEAGDAETLTATISPADATNKAVTWESSDEDVATVVDGVVTAVGVGSATITVKSVADDTKTATCAVTVKPTAVSSVSLNRATALLMVGKYLTLTATVSPTNATDKTVNWESDNTGVATVSSAGVVTAIALGTATITAKSNADNTKSAACVVTVSDGAIDLRTTGEGITFGSWNQTMLGDSYGNRDCEIVGSDGNSYTWKEVNGYYNNDGWQIKASTGKVTSPTIKSNHGFTIRTTKKTNNVIISDGTNRGTNSLTTTKTSTTITIEGDGAYAVFTGITITPLKTPISTDVTITDPGTLAKDGTGTFAAASTDADDCTKTWTSSNSSVIEITNASTGAYTAVGRGTATITCTITPVDTENYGMVSVERSVSVSAPVAVTANDVDMTYGDAAKAIGAAVSDGYAGTLTYESANTSVATVDASGEVTAVAVGSTTITITAPADAENLYTAGSPVVISVTVNAPSGLTEFPVGDAVQLYKRIETKGTGLPAGWTTDAGNLWHYDVNYGAVAGGEQTGVQDTNYDMVTEDFDLSGYREPFVYFSHVGNKISSNKKTVCKLFVQEGSETPVELTIPNWFGGTNWTFVNSGNIDLSDYAGKTVHFIFRYTPSGTNANGTWEVKDFTIKAYNIPSANVTLNKYGYATYCSVNPIDFTNTTGYTAWRVSDITSEGVITFTKITDKIKGGQGVVLYNKDADGVNTSDVTVTFDNGTTVFTPSENKLVGTLAPTYVEDGTAYGLSGNKFVVNNAPGNISAGKAYIEASSIPTGVKDFTLVFEDETTGITETRTATREEIEAIFNLAGQRMSRMHKGVNIVNGKKILVK